MAVIDTVTTETEEKKKTLAEILAEAGQSTDTDDIKHILIKYMQKDTRKLEIDETGVSDWIDVYSDAELEIMPGQHVLIPLGFCAQLPKGYEAHLAARSSLFKSTGLLVANGVGVIDESYCGDNDEWKLSVWNTGIARSPDSNFGGVFIHRGDKIAQFRIMKKMPTIHLVEVETLDNIDRGGFGSTGN